MTTPVSLPRMSVVIPTYNRPARLLGCLRSMDAIAYPTDRYEIIVADDGSPAPVEPLVQQETYRVPVRVVRQPNAGSGAARNLAAESATGDYLVFTADDCAPDADWLDRFAEAFSRPGCGTALIGGSIRHGLPRNLCSTASHMLIEYLCSVYNARPNETGFFTPNNLAVHRASFLDADGFDRTIGMAGEDLEFCARWLRQSRHLAVATDAVVTHDHPLTLPAFVRQQYIYGLGSARARHRLPATEAPSKRTPQPLSFYARLVAFPLRSGWGPRALVLCALLVLSQGVNAVAVLRESRRLRRRA